MEEEAGGEPVEEPPKGRGSPLKKKVTCCLCRRRLNKRYFSAYFRSVLLADPLSRRCLDCSDVHVKTRRRQTAKDFGDTRMEYNVFEGVRQGNVARVWGDLADKTVAVDAKDRDTGRTLLHEAAAVGDTEMCELLIGKFGAHVDSRSLVTRETPLFVAVANDHFDTTLLLLENGADPNMRNKHYSTPLHYADSMNVANLLMEQAGLDAEVRDATGATAIDVIRARAKALHGGVFEELVESPSKSKSRALAMSLAAKIATTDVDTSEAALKERRRMKNLLKFLDEKSSSLRVRAALREEAALARRAKIDRDARNAADQRRAELLRGKSEAETKVKLDRWKEEYQMWRQGKKPKRNRPTQHGSSMELLKRVVGATPESGTPKSRGPGTSRSSRTSSPVRTRRSEAAREEVETDSDDPYEYDDESSSDEDE